jgi:hypothetical protein
MTVLRRQTPFFPVIDPARGGITKKEKHIGFSFVLEYHLIR